MNIAKRLQTRFCLILLIPVIALGLAGIISSGPSGEIIDGLPITIIDQPQIAMDEFGNAIVVASYGYYDPGPSKEAIFYNFYHQGSGWEYAMETGNYLTDQNQILARHPAVDMNNKGDGIVAWEQWVEADQEYRVFARRYVMGWQASQLVDYRDPPIYFGNGSNPQTAMDENGNAIVVWLQGHRTNINGEVIGFNALWANRYDVDSDSWFWSPEPISDFAAAANPQIVMINNGNAIAVWEQGAYIYANHYMAGQSRWGYSSATQIALGDSPQLVADSCGNATVVFQSDGNIYAIHYAPASGWTVTAEKIDAGKGWASEPQIDNNGFCVGSGSARTMVVWKEDDGGATPSNVYARLHTTGGIWLPATSIESGDRFVNDPQIAMEKNSAGKARVVWWQDDGLLLKPNYFLYTNHFDPIKAWEGECRLDAGDRWGIGNPRIAADTGASLERVIAVWDNGLAAQFSGGNVYDYIWDGWQDGCGLAAPQNIQATAGDGRVTLNWDTVAVASSYNLYWNITGGVSTADNVINDITLPFIPFAHTSLNNDTSYYYIVTAVNAAIEGPPSSEVSATPTAAGVNFTLEVQAYGISGASGNVASSPIGIDCNTPNTCNYDFVNGSLVRLTAVAVAPSFFEAWSGPDACDSSGVDGSGNNYCDITVFQDMSIIALFGSP